MRKRKGFKLRTILGLLVVSSVMLTAVVGGYFAVTANVKSLSYSYLESNYQYAKKLASNTTSILDIMQSNMNSLAGLAGESTVSQRDLDVWFKANEEYFNSVFITDSKRYIKAVTPEQEYSLIGSQLTSEASIQAVDMKSSIISEPYIATTGRLILMISSPIYDTNGYYKGFAGGTIYLQEDNVLSRLLSEHFYGNGSYVYVMDDHSHLIFHPDFRRISQPIMGNEVVQQVISGESGSAKVTNTQGNTFFAGYAYEPRGGWGIVSQTPVSVLDEPLKKLVWNMLLQALPICIFILFVAWRVSRYIAAPLYELAKFSEDTVMDPKSVPLAIPNISSHIYEVRQLHHSIGNHLNLFNDEIQIDDLTGLANRKKFDLMLQACIEARQPFALILIDIDFFKRVNDMYGDAIGDEVLQYLASEMRSFAGCEDVCFRYGGEEFGIVMMNSSLKNAVELADALRQKMDEAVGPSGIPVTISLGISIYNETELITSKDIVERADSALYRSKLEGRNRVTVFTPAEI